MIYDKPTGEIFASEAITGESAEFPDILRGWGITKEQTASKPPMSWMNGAFKRIDENLEYLRQRGIAEWDEKLTYPVGAYVQYKGKTWKAVSESIGKEPNISEEWVKWAFTSDEIKSLIDNLNLKEASKREVGNAENQIPDMSYFSSSIDWGRLPSGLIFQRGISLAGDLGAPASINFPIAFPNNSYTVIACYDNARAGVAHMCSFATTPLNSSSFALMANISPSTVYAHWIAFGK